MDDTLLVRVKKIAAACKQIIYYDQVLGTDDRVLTACLMELRGCWRQI